MVRLLLIVFSLLILSQSQSVSLPVADHEWVQVESEESDLAWMPGASFSLDAVYPSFVTIFPQQERFRFSHVLKHRLPPSNAPPIIFFI